MRTILLTLLLLLSSALCEAQNLYIETFGKPTDQPLIFIHGGPGYNSANFESSTARQLAESGFFVLVYDRRGEGRSSALPAKFTYDETVDDLKMIFDSHKMRNAILVGHSFGGVVAIKYAEKYPENTKAIVLVGAPVSFQETFSNIIDRSKHIYEAKGDSMNLKYVGMLQKMDTASIMYSSYCFRHAMQNGFYSPKQPTDEAKAIYAAFKADTALIKHASEMSMEAPQGFWKNEKYTVADLSTNLKALKQKGIPIYGLYGKEDGLFAPQQIEKLQTIIGAENLKYLDNCSHNVFMDQQQILIQSVKTWTVKLP